jgi:hypothetical protein
LIERHDLCERRSGRKRRFIVDSHLAVLRTWSAIRRQGVHLVGEHRHNDLSLEKIERAA